MTAAKMDAQGFNAFYEMMLAIQSSVTGVASQQKTDANTTVVFGELEMKLNDYWYGPDNGNGTCQGSPLQNYVDAINKVVNNYDPKVPGSANIIKNLMTEYNSDYRVASTEASNATSYVDARVQQSNAQVRTDSENIKSICQIADTLNIMSYILRLTSK